MKYLNLIFPLLFMGCADSDPTEEPRNLQDLKIPFERFVDNGEGEAVFVGTVNNSYRQTSFAIGNYDERIFIPRSVRNDESIKMVYSDYNSSACVVFNAEDRIKGEEGKIFTDLNWTHIILCPINKTGYVGAAYSDVPPIQELPKIKKLVDLADEYLP